MNQPGTDSGRIHTDVDERVLGLLAGTPPLSRPWSVAVIVLLVSTIAALDVLSGAEISLRPIYFIPIALSVAWLGWRAAVVIAVISTAVWYFSDYVVDAPGIHGFAAYWNSAVSFISFLLMIWVIQVLRSLQLLMEQRVKDRTAALAEAFAVQDRLRMDLSEIGSRERNSIGHELHDGLCQHFTGTALAAQVLAERMARRNAPETNDARTIVRLVEEGIQQSRLLARGLLLSAIEPERLIPELEELAATTCSQSKVECRLETEGNPEAPDSSTASQFFRIAQEAVRNALHHANPSHIYLRLSGSSEHVELTISDDGTGFVKDQGPSGMGLKVMASRAAAIRAEFAVESRTEGGTRVRCDWRAPS